jgi:hypothetical protein
METFVIQLPAEVEQSVKSGTEELREVVEHVASGRRQTFRDTRELLAFLRTGNLGQPKELEQ